MKHVDVMSLIPAEYVELAANAIDVIVPFISTAITPLLLTIVFWVLYLILNLIHVNLVYKFIVNRQKKKEAKKFRAYLEDESERAKKAILEEHKNEAQASSNEELEIYTHKVLDDDEIDVMLDERIRNFKKAFTIETLQIRHMRIS
jgi:hypothetical protein